jgi:cytochrome c oxidase subunit 3
MLKQKILKEIPNLVKAQKSPFHVVPKSPWPLLVSLSLFFTLASTVMKFHYFFFAGVYLIIGFLLVLFFITRWCLDIILESFKGNHTSYVANGLRIGFILLIVSEIMFFFSFFWGYFHITFSLSVHTGVTWPYVKGPYPWALPFLNTMILSLSSLTLTEAHLFFLKKKIFNYFIFFTYYFFRRFFYYYSRFRIFRFSFNF